jgi:hypothetical protein
MGDGAKIQVFFVFLFFFFLPFSRLALPILSLHASHGGMRDGVLE